VQQGSHEHRHNVNPRMSTHAFVAMNMAIMNW
jgi:hypothetical protein